MADILVVARSYIVLQLLALAGWPWLAALLRFSRAPQSPQNQSPLPADLCVSLAKSLGLVLVAYATWLLGFARAPIAAPTIWLVWAAVAAGGLAAARLRPADIARAFSQHRRAIVIGEIVFLVVFLSLCRVRALTPDVTFRYDEQGRDYDPSASEKFTNLALLTGLDRERHLPPRDTWLAGYPINYYYFGHFQWTVFFKMAAVSPRVGFNIGQAALFALIASNAFGLALHLTRRTGPALLAAYAVPIMGSPYGFVQLLLQGLRHYQFWEASRIVEGTIADGQIAGPITELPFFTFIVGDFHAHGMSFHSYLLALAVAFLFPFAARRKPISGENAETESRHVPFRAALGVFLLALLLAATAMTNTWDAPSLGLLIGVILVTGSLGQGGFRPARLVVAVSLSAAVALAAWVFLLPHLATFAVPVAAARDPAAFYVGPLKWLGTAHLSEFKDYMVHFGFLAIPPTLAIHGRLIARSRQSPRSWPWRAVLGLLYLVALYVFLFAQRFFLLFFLATMIGCALVLVLVELRRTAAADAVTADPHSRVCVALGVLSGVAFFLSLFAEGWVVDDGYTGPFERYNTVFKIYNVCWLLYGVSFAASVHVLLPPLAGGWRSLARWPTAWPWAALAMLLLLGFAYPFAATWARLEEQRLRARSRERIALPPGPALDAVRYYASVNRDEYRLIEWIAANVAGKPVVAEGCRRTDAYRLQSRVATFTGLRAVLAWPQHQANWRSAVPSSLDPARTVPIWSEMNSRINDLAALYTARDAALIDRIVKRYAIDYIVIGKWERALYGRDAGRFLRGLYQPVFESGDAVLLKTTRENPEHY